MSETKARKIELTVAFDFGDIVFLRVKSERVAGMVTSYSVTRTCITYRVTWSDNLAGTWHYAYELTDEFIPNFTN